MKIFKQIEQSFHILNFEDIQAILGSIKRYFGC